MVAAGELLAARLSLPPAGRRDIVVLSGPWTDPVARSMLSWATVTGAAVVLEPLAERRVATAVWARPTVFHGSAAEVEALCHAAKRAARRRAWRGRPRPPLGRLRAVLLTGGEELLPADRGWLAERGVEIFCGALSFPR
jgi:hypothetical protein